MFDDSRPERKRGSDRDIFGEVEYAKVAVETADAMRHEPRKHKESKPSSSQAERTRVRQGWVLILFGCLNLCLTTLIALRAFGIIA